MQSNYPLIDEITQRFDEIALAYEQINKKLAASTELRALSEKVVWASSAIPKPIDPQAMEKMAELIAAYHGTWNQMTACPLVKFALVPVAVLRRDHMN